MPIVLCELVSLEHHVLHAKVFTEHKLDGQNFPGKFLVPDRAVRKELEALLLKQAGRSDSTKSIPRVYWFLCHSFDFMVAGRAEPIREQDIPKLISRQIYCQGTLFGVSYEAPIGRSAAS
jgi:hypothetical protein